VILLATHFMHKFSGKIGKTVSGISDQAIQLLLTYPWPGNIRELEHVIERACVLCLGPTISTEHLPLEVTTFQPEAPSFSPERNPMLISSLPEIGLVRPQGTVTEDNNPAVTRILAALSKAGGNKAKAARLLGMDRSTLYRKVREFQINLDELKL